MLAPKFEGGLIQPAGRGLGAQRSRIWDQVDAWSSYSKSVEAEKLDNKKWHLKMSFPEMLCFLCWVTLGLLGSAGVMIISHKLHKNFKAAIRRTVSSQFSTPSKVVPIASAEEAALSPLGHWTPPPALDMYLLWFTQRRQDFHQLSLPLYPKS